MKWQPNTHAGWETDMTLIAKRKGGITFAVVMLIGLWAGPVRGGDYAMSLIGADAVAQTNPALTGQAQRVAVLDSGIQFDHAAFDGRVIGGINFAGGAPWASTDPAAWTDRTGHGTFVAGVIGSSNASYTGLAPGAELLAVRIADADGASSLTQLLQGLQWVNQHAEQYNITAVNISLGTMETFAAADDTPDTPVYNAIEQQFAALKAADIVSVVGSGNAGSTTGLSMPAITEDVISVAASTADDTLLAMSNRNDRLELLAPGHSITSTWKNDAYTAATGTSFAAPFVTGSAVIIREALQMAGLDLRGDFNTYQDHLLHLLQSTGTNVYDPATDLTFKRLDLRAALDAIDLTATPIPIAVYVPEPAACAVFILGAALLHRRRRV